MPRNIRDNMGITILANQTHPQIICFTISNFLTFLNAKENFKIVYEIYPTFAAYLREKKINDTNVHDKILRLRTEHTGVSNMAADMDRGRHPYSGANHFVERNMLVQRQDGGQWRGTQQGVALPQHQDQDKHTVEVEQHPSDACN